MPEQKIDLLNELSNRSHSNSEWESIVKNRRIRTNKFVDEGVIPLGIDSNYNVVTMPYKKFSGTLAIIGRSGTGKSVLSKRVFSYLGYYYNKKYGKRRSGIIFDLQSDDWWRSYYPNSRPKPLFARQGESPFGMKNIKSYAPYFTQDEKHSFDKMFAFDLTKLSTADMKYIFGKKSDNVIASLNELIEDNKTLIRKDLKIFRVQLDFLPTDDFDADNVPCQLKVKRPFHQQTKNSIIGKLSLLITEKIIVDEQNPYFKDSFEDDLKEGRIAVINFHQERERVGLYGGIILKQVYEHAREAYRKKQPFNPPVIVIEEADLLLGKEEESLDKGATYWATQVLRRGRRYGLFLMFITQEVTSLHPQIKDHVQNWLIGSNITQKDMEFFKKIFSTEAVYAIETLNKDKSGWGATEWIFLNDKGEWKKFWAYNSPTEINRERGA